MKRWFADRSLWRLVLLAVALRALDGVAGVLDGWPHPWRGGWGVTCGIVIGAAAMRMWTWKDKP